jgi:hypothetical protein
VVNSAERIGEGVHLADLKSLLAAMPTPHQAFTAKRTTKNWAEALQRRDRAGEATRHIFGEADSVRVSRNDLREWARLENLDCVVMGTLLWGYPDGMRGNHASNIADNLVALTDLLGEASLGISNWKEHYDKVEAIPSIGPSTYTKFLNFLSVSVSGKTALILDKRIIDVAKNQVFEEFTGSLTALRYPRYLERMHSIADTLEVEAESLEFFLFEFGLHLKQPKNVA